MVQNKKILSLIIIIIISVIIGSFIRDRRNNLLQDKTKTTKGIFKKFTDMAKVCDESDFEYQINGEKFELTVCGEFSFLQKGDTVLIKYSLKDPSVSELMDVYYMNKYRHFNKE